MLKSANTRVVWRSSPEFMPSLWIAICTLRALRRRRMRRVLTGVLLVFAIACGSDNPSSNPSPVPAPTPAPTPAPAPAPDVSGRYSGLLTLQVLRSSDNFQTSFNCSAQMTVTQSPGSSATAGFWLTSSPCEPVTFDTAGTVQSGGATTIHTNGPRPPQGPCPGGKDMDFSGIFTTTGTRALSARATTKVQCGDLGEHTFTYIWALNRLN